MRRKIIILALAACSCSKTELPSLPPDCPPEPYGTEDIVLVRKNGSRLLAGENTYSGITEKDTLTVYAYPNTMAPVTVESTDSTVLVPTLLDGSRVAIDCLSAGKASLVFTSEGTARRWNFTVSRSLLYDLKYDPSRDRLTLEFAQNPSDPIEDDFWERMTADLHITTVWSYKVGFGSNYMNTRYPRTSVLSGEYPACRAIVLESLEKEYRKVRDLYDEEFAIEYAKDPDHAWSSWSGIELKVIIRNPEECLHLQHSRGADSAYGYTLGFTLSHSLIED